MSSSAPSWQGIEGKWRSIGEGEVLRFLPTARRRTVGPFVFVDHMGARRAEAGTVTQPALVPDQAAPLPLHVVDVPPHPHIGIATVTYLFSGALFHRDSIGSAQLIEPGAVNWMTSGRGIVHSERTPPELRRNPPPLYGVQSWVALPKGGEDVEPTFQHVPALKLPVVQREGVSVRLIAGSGFGLISPVVVASPLLCAAVQSGGAGRLRMPADHEERAILLLDGTAFLDGAHLPRGTMAVLPAGGEPELIFESAGRAFLIGGPPLPEKRHLDWNFCSTRLERISEAKELYRKGELGEIPGEGPNLPLPQDVR